MPKECPKCQSTEFETVAVDNIHKFAIRCGNCGSFVQFGKTTKTLTDGVYELMVEMAEEIGNKFILFKLTNGEVTVKKQIWKNEQGKYYSSLKVFINEFDKLLECKFLHMNDILEYLKGKQVIATIENVKRKGKRICDIKTIDKIL